MTATTIASINEVNALLAGTAVSAIAIPAPKKVAKKAAPKVNTRLTLDGRTMKADAGTITPGQVKRITAYAKANGWNLVDDITTWSMADAADEYLSMLKDDGKIA